MLTNLGLEPQLIVLAQVRTEGHMVILMTIVMSHLARSDTPTLLELCRAWPAVTPSAGCSLG